MPRLARYQRQVSPDVVTGPEGIGGNIAQALDSFGRDFQRTVDPMLAQRQANDIQSTIAGGGDVSPALGLTPMQLQRNAVAGRAYADRASLEVHNAATALHQQYDGSVPDGVDVAKYVGEFGSKLDEAAKPALERIPAAFRGAAEAQYQETRTRSVTQLQERAFEHQDRMHLANMKAADELDLNQLKTAARDGDAEAMGRYATSMATRRQEMVDAGLMPAQVAELEGVHVAGEVLGEKLYGDVLRGRGPSLEDVEAGKGEAAGLPLDLRDQLARQIRGYQAHQRAMASASRGEAKAGYKQAGVVANGYAKAIENNIPLDPNQQAEADGLIARERQARAAGLSTMPDAAFRNLEEASVVRNLTGDVVRGTVAEAQSALAKIDAYRPRDINEAGIKEKSRKVVEGFVADVTSDDPIGKLQQRGAFFRGLPPVDFSTPEAFAQTLAARGQTVEAASMQYGWELPPLAKLESEQFARAMDGWDVAQQSAALAALNAQGPAAGKIRADLSEKGSPTFAMAGTAAAAGDTATAEAMLRGNKIRAAKLYDAPPEAEKTSAIASSNIVGVLPPETAGEVVSAAEALVADAQSRGEELSMDAAIKKAGGHIVDYNGRSVALPFGVPSKSAFEDIVEQVDDSEIVGMGGTPEAAAAFRRGEAKLASLPGGKYLVAIPSVYGTNLAPFQFDPSKVAPKPAKPALEGLPITRAIVEASGDTASEVAKVVEKHPAVRLAKDAAKATGIMADLVSETAALLPDGELADPSGR